MPRSILAAIGLSIGMIVSAVAGPLDDAAIAVAQQRYSTAWQILRPLADGGNVEAIHQLGAMTYFGQGVRQDYSNAASLYKLAAERGYAKSQTTLGVLYQEGRGVPQDYEQALAWFRRAAAQSYPVAMVNLGAMYEKGLGLPRDLVMAHMWLNLGISCLPADDSMREFQVSRRDQLANQMTLKQITDAQRLAREWFSRR